MKTLLIAHLLYILLPCFVKAQNNDTIAPGIMEQLNADWKEYVRTKQKLLKKVTYNKDSAEEYYIAKDKTKTFLIHTVKKKSSPTVYENNYYFYLDGRFFKLQYSDRHKGRFGLMRTRKKGIYLFLNDREVYRRETGFVQDTNFVQRYAKEYYENALIHLTDLEKK